MREFKNRECFSEEEMQEATNIGFWIGTLTGVVVTVVGTLFGFWIVGWI